MRCKWCSTGPKIINGLCPYCQRPGPGLPESIEDLIDRVEELEKKVNRVPGSIPGDYTWDELVGKHDD